MDGLKLQAKVNKGFRISASKVGLPHDHYRPSGDSDPLAAGHRLLDPLMAAFEPAQFTFRSPKRDDIPLWSVLVDGDVAETGDYLVRGTEVWFIAEKAALLPIRAVQCSTVLALRRPTASDDVGVAAYGGDVPDQEAVLASGWPAGISLDGRGERTDVRLPADTRFGSFAVYLPLTFPADIRTGDLLQDASGMRLLVSSAIRVHGAIKALAQQVTV